MAARLHTLRAASSCPTARGILPIAGRIVRASSITMLSSKGVAAHGAGRRRVAAGSPRRGTGRRRDVLRALCERTDGRRWLRRQHHASPSASTPATAHAAHGEAHAHQGQPAPAAAASVASWPGHWCDSRRECRARGLCRPPDGRGPHLGSCGSGATRRRRAPVLSPLCQQLLTSPVPGTWFSGCRPEQRAAPPLVLRI